jgi:hypothetical protein
MNDNLDLEKLRGFAQALLVDFPDYMGVDGFDLQALAVEHGLLVETIQHEPCSDGCSCASYYASDEFKEGVVCYRKSPLLMGGEA